MDGYVFETLEVAGYDATVPNNYWTVGSDTLLIMLPGLGYTNQMPLMFYLNELATGRRWDVLQVNYDYRSVPRDTTATEWGDRMFADVHPVIETALGKGTYKHVVLAGKSIGTSVMATLLARGFKTATAYIWLTPLLRSVPVRNAVMSHGPAIAIFGDKDYAVSEVDLAPISQAGVHMIVMPDADHGMMIRGNLPQSISALAHVMHELDTWLEQNTETTGDNE